MTDERMALIELVEKPAEDDLVREMLAFAAERIMELEVEARTGAAKGARSPHRHSQCQAARRGVLIKFGPSEDRRSYTIPRGMIQRGRAWYPESPSLPWPGGTAWRRTSCSGGAGRWMRTSHVAAIGSRTMASAMAVGSNGPVVGAFEVRKLGDRVRDLERLLGRKTMENEILREALAKAQAKKQTWHLPSPPKDGFR